MNFSFDRNDPFEFEKIEGIFASEQELHLAWPSAKWPLCPKQWHEWMCDNDESEYIDILMYSEKGENIGHAALKRYRRAPYICYLCFVYLVPAYRGSGASTLLIDHSISEGRKKWNLEEIHLLVDPNNRRAFLCYDRYGFKSFGGMMGDKLRMRKIIDL